MGNAFDRAINKGPPFSQKCVPECKPNPNDLRGNTCYKGKCVPLCPVNSKMTESGDCLCIEDNAKFIDSNSKMKNKPLEGDGWGYCSTDKLENKFKPEYLFVDRVPKELDSRVKDIVRKELRKNPNMSDKELSSLISQTTIYVIEELATECKDEYKVVKMILSPSYGNGKWPSKDELKVLIKTKNFPWLNSQIDQWPEEKEITSCKILSAVKDKIAINNVCMYSDEYSEVVQECNVECGLGTEIRQKKIIKKPNNDFPSLQSCESSPPSKEFECDSGLICKENCKLEINMKSFGEAKCSKPCDSGNGPGTKTYKVKYVKASKGEPGNKGSCELDEEGKVEGKEYDVTVDCNKDKCPDCEVVSKGPFKDELIDYTGSINVNGKNKIYTKCLLPKKDGTFEDIDCGGAKGGFNYNKGARAKYEVNYKITRDSYGVQTCTKGKDVVEEGCPVNAFDPNLNPIVGNNGKLLLGGGEECGNECILSDDFPKKVLVNGKECSKECGGGLQRMRKVVKSKSDAPYCPCKDDPNKCPYEEVPCNTQDCIADCVYDNDGRHVQINDYCPGVEGPNKHIVWDSEKINSKKERGMWYDSKKNKYYERKHFVKKMRVPTLKPTIGKGLCYQGDKADKTLPCPISGVEKPIDAEWGPWKFESHMGKGYTLGEIGEEYSTWDHKDNPNFGKKGEHCVIEDGLEETDTILPGIRYTRELKKLSDGEPGPRYGGKSGSQVDGGNNIKIEPYMKKNDGTYTKYCPVAAQLTPELDIDTISITGSLSNQERCYLENDEESRGKYTTKELEQESKRKFERNSELPEYNTSREDIKKTRIVSPGNRTIYRSKSREVNTLQKHGGFPSGSWHKTSEGYTKNHLADRRLHEYDECVGVGEVLEKIRKNDPSWKSANIVKQEDCVPIYEWDGKFYKDKQSAEAGNNGEEIMRPQHGSKNESGTSAKHPGQNIRKSGKFLFSSTWNNTQYHEGGLDKEGEHKNHGWHYKFGLEGSTKEWIIMETVSGNIELVKGIVLQARGNSGQGLQGAFKIKVSRNGDSWKNVISNVSFNGSYKTFKNNHDIKTHEGRDKYNKHYFAIIEQAKFIKIYDFPAGSSFRIGYIQDKSGAVQCSGGSGLLQSEPWFRFVFNEAKTRDPKLGGKYSEGTAASTKRCPDNGSIMIKQKGKISSGPNGIPVEDLKLLRGGSVKSLSNEMAKQVIKGCGVDPTSKGWFSSDSFASPKKWSACVKPTNTGFESNLAAWHKDDGGFRYMYRDWQGSNNNGYNKLSDDQSSYLNNTHPSSANNGSTYNKIPSSFTINNYDSVNIVRQPCNRGEKMKLPSLGTEWVSTIPASTGGTSGWKGNIWNYKGGTEGWLDQPGKMKWSNGFLNKVYDLIKNKGIGSRKDVNEYLVEEKEGTNGNDDNNSWSGHYRGSYSKINGTHAWHSPSDWNKLGWNTSLTEPRNVAIYSQSKNFIPVGIKIQPRKNCCWDTQQPTEIRLVWKGDSTSVTLGPFNSRDEIKTILIDPGLRKETDHLKVHTRHGRKNGWVSFRINFLIGKIGGGYSQDKGHSVNNNNKRPVDCQDGGLGVEGSKIVNVGKQTVNNPGWTWSNCSKPCDGGSKNGSRTVTYTQKQKYTKVDPAHGGKNKCSDTNAPNVTSSKKETTTAKCNTHECAEPCHGNWSEWKNNNSVCCCDRLTGKDIFQGNKCKFRCDGQYRYYTVTKKARGGGKACEATNDQGQTRRVGWRHFWAHSGSHGSC